MTSIRQIIRLVLVLSLSISTLSSATGCASIRKKTKREDVRTGLLGNDREKLVEAFDKIERNKTTRKGLEAIGFDLGAPNIQVFVGVPAFRELFGQEAFRNMAGNEFDKRLPEYNRYTLYQIPFKQTLVTSDRIYLNKKVTTTVGWDIVYSIVLHDDVVVYNAPRAVFLDQTQVDKAFLQGLLAVFGELSGALGFARP